ncbi:hypothetical protein QEZ52_10215 [Aliisedimentitalea scapharcae]|uniref:YfaZ n=1 Tax=Aliisedimentitalea scapharcae TaxID=1524259 RepID=A0ABZ2XYY9_9RHOB
MAIRDQRDPRSIMARFGRIGCIALGVGIGGLAGIGTGSAEGWLPTSTVTPVQLSVGQRADMPGGDAVFGVMLRRGEPLFQHHTGQARAVNQVAVGTRFGSGALAGFVGVGSPLSPGHHGHWTELPMSLGFDYVPAQRVLFTGEILFPAEQFTGRAPSAPGGHSVLLSASFRF